MTLCCMFLSSPFAIPKALTLTQPTTRRNRIRCSPSGLGPLQITTPNMKVTVVETHNITLLPNTATTELPLTFLDIFWIPFKTQVIFFYSIPSITTQRFITSLLPNLKTSLSTSLQLFFPLTGIFTPPTTPSSKPFIHFSNDSFVPLVIAEEAALGRSCFNHLIGKDKTRRVNANEFYPLVPELVKDELTGGLWSSVLALQVTVFPDYGICFGITFKHVAADGKSIAAFLHTWASICENKCIIPENTIMPIFDRSLIPDANGTIFNTCLKQFLALKSSAECEDVAISTQVESEVIVRGTFVVTKSEIQNMKMWILKHVGNEDLHISTFVLACSLIWVSLIKSAKVVRTSDVCPTDVSYFGQAVDSRDRYEFKSIVPLAYFGNCIGCGCNAQAKTTDLENEDGIVVAVKAIGNRIKRLQLDGTLCNVESWIPDFFETSRTGNIVSVAGSPRLGFYGLDFGWGRPVKVEFVSIGGGAISISEHVGDEGGVEFGIALGIDEMEAFASILDECKCKYCRPC